MTGPRKLANTRSSPQLILNQIHEESEEGQHSLIDPVDNFPQTSAGVAVIRRLEQRRRLKFHKARTTSCSSSDASDDEVNLGLFKITPGFIPLDFFHFSNDEFFDFHYFMGPPL